MAVPSKKPPTFFPGTTTPPAELSQLRYRLLLRLFRWRWHASEAGIWKLPTQSGTNCSQRLRSQVTASHDFPSRCGPTLIGMLAILARQRYPPTRDQQDSMKVSIREQAIDHNLSTIIDRSCPLQSQKRSRRNKTSGSHPARHPVQHACRPPRHAEQSAVHVVLGACCSNVLVEISFQLE